jgi:hypothetical protein
MPGFNLPAVSVTSSYKITYPISEQNLNQANYTAASAIGGDEQTTKIFWDKN